MRLYKLDKLNAGLIDNKELICDEIISAENFFERLFGLIFMNLKANQGFLINNCNSIHTFWMRYKIDLLFHDFGKRRLDFEPYLLILDGLELKHDFYGQ